MAQLIKQRSFLDFYKSEITPKIENLDLLLKQGDISEQQASLALDVSCEEIKSALRANNLSTIKADTILPLLMSLDSFICRLLKREIECGSPRFYSPAAVSYIYNIDKNVVKNAFDFLELKWVYESQLPAIFAQIFLADE